jgi:hypothetical protein
VIFRRIRSLGLLMLFAGAPVCASASSGRISGVVLDPAGTPQMGATVLVSAESLLAAAPVEFLTNDRGHFVCNDLAPGFYTIRVTLAGYLPAIDQHIRVNSQRTTLLQIGLGSIFTSLEGLRRQPNQQVSSDEWDWVLRSSTSVRPVLRWDDTDDDIDFNGPSLYAELPGKSDPRGRVELTSGARHPGSVANLAGAPGTAVAYDQDLGREGRLLLAGQFSYESASPSGGFAAEWLPEGSSGSVTNVVVRESQLGPAGPTFRGMRLNHDGQLQLGSRVSVRYGAEYLAVGLDGSTASIRPRTQVAIQLAPDWQASFIVASAPWADTTGTGNELQSALDSLDGFPTLLLHNSRPVLEDDLHEEIGLRHTVSASSSVEAAVFHDRSSNTAVFGQGNVINPDFLQDFFSNAFAYDAGTSDSWGARVAYRQKVASNTDVTFVYAWGGALTPDGPSTAGELKDALRERGLQSAAGRVSTRVPKIGTYVTTGYKWIGGPAVSQVDGYGETFYQVDPYLSLILRQPLPSFFPGHMQAVADFGNLLAQGYIPVASRDGQVYLVSTCRSFRGGLSFQF